MTLRFLAAAAPRTNGLALSKVEPSATPAAPRRKSRRLRPRCCAIFLAKDDWSVILFIWLNRRIALLPLVPCRGQPCAAPEGADRLQTLPARAPFARCAHSPGRDGNGRREDWHSIPAPAGIRGWTSRTGAGQRRDCPVAHALRALPDRALPPSAAATR